MLIAVYEYDGVPFERTVDGKWICKALAMRGPTGTMLNKEVPDPYAKTIEQAYQALQNSKASKIKLIGRRNSDSDEVQEIDPMEKKIEKLKKKLELKESKQTAQKIEQAQQKVKKNLAKAEPLRKEVKERVNKNLLVGFNPFEK